MRPHQLVLATILLLTAALALGATCSGQPLPATARAVRTPALPTATLPAAPATATLALGATERPPSPRPSSVSPPSPTARIRPGANGLYIALGDSLSAGYGASSASTTFVELVHAGLGPGMELMNLDVPGATSTDLLNDGQLDRAVAEIAGRDGDADPDNDVQLITLEIGGNDLVALFTSLVLTGICPDVEVGFQKPECVEPLRATFDHYLSNLTKALDRLEAADSAVPIVLSTQYNPLGYIPSLGELGDLSIEGLPNTVFPEGLNDIIRNVATGRADVTVVDMYGPFLGHTPEYISGDGIHPNDAGYATMADAEIAAIAALRTR